MISVVAVIMFALPLRVDTPNRAIRLIGIGVRTVKFCSITEQNKLIARSALTPEVLITPQALAIINFLTIMLQMRSMDGGGAVAARIFTSRIMPPSLAMPRGGEE